MTLRQIGAVVVCAFALTVSAAEAKQRHKQVRHDSQAAVQCAPNNSGHFDCGQAPARVTRRAPALDSNGNAGRHETALGAKRGYCHVDTAAGPIVIACRLADKMKGFIADVVARGFKGRVKCFSLSKSHVARSLHFIAEACDFAQRGWGKTVAPMYRVADLARKWGLRDGCTFRDCGHIDSGRGVARVPWPARMAEMKAKMVRQ